MNQWDDNAAKDTQTFRGINQGRFRYSCRGGTLCGTVVAKGYLGPYLFAIARLGYYLCVSRAARWHRYDFSGSERRVVEASSFYSPKACVRRDSIDISLLQPYLSVGQFVEAFSSCAQGP
jgi:hypothetical protein